MLNASSIYFETASFRSSVKVFPFSSRLSMVVVVKACAQSTVLLPFLMR